MNSNPSPFDPETPLPAEYAALAAESEGEKLPTLEAVGKTLPIGYPDPRDPAKIHRDFEIVAEWGWDVEVELADLAEKEPDLTMGAYIAEVVGRGLVRLGEIEVEKLSRPHRRLLVSQMFYNDVLFVYTWIRVKALGRKIGFDPFDCPKCKQSIDFEGDLLSLEVKVFDGEGVPTGIVPVDPFVYGGEEFREVEIQPLRWAFMEASDVSALTNSAKLRARTLQFGIRGFVGRESPAPIAVTDTVLRALGPKGVNAISNAIDDLGGGVVFVCEGRHECGHRYVRVIDWTYHDFFGRSSR